VLPRSDGLTYTGYVDDIRPEIAESWASVVPLRRGGGTRVKILESMALGTPVVSTPKGAEGLDVVPGQHILLAEHPDEFARHVVDLCQSPGLRRRLAENGSQLVSSRYDWNSVGEQILAVVERAAQEPALARSRELVK
jgi:polysaccharide biosynthesis protein PslH